MGRIVTGIVLLGTLAGLAYGFRDTIAEDPMFAPWIADAAALVETQRADTAPAFLTAKVAIGVIEQSVSVTGALNAVLTVELGSQLAGQVSRLMVDFNDRVEEGDPLAELDRGSFEARVAEARASLAMSHASVSIQKAKIRRAEIELDDATARLAINDARVENARIRLEAAERDFSRKQQLASRDAAAATVVEDAGTAVASAYATLREEDAVLAAHAFAVAGSASDIERLQSELRLAEGTVAQREALLEIAAIDLERTVIRAPISGIVVGRSIDEGQMIATGLEARTIFVIARDLAEMEIHTRVDETDIGKIRIGQHALYTVDAHPGRQFEAVVRQVRQAAQVTQNVVTYTVVLTASNAEGLLLPGMTAVVRIVTDDTGPVLTLPLAALRYAPRAEAGGGPGRQGDDRVWVLTGDGGARPVRVALGADDTSRVAVLHGELADGDDVVVGESSLPPGNRLFGIRLGF